MRILNCVNCGAKLEPRNRFVRLMTCNFCDTSHVVADEVVQNAGSSGEMLDLPSLLKIGEPVRLGGIGLTPLGHARFDYGRGWWDEFWCEGDNEMLWVSLDEGDIAIERSWSGPSVGQFEPETSMGLDIDGQWFTVTEHSRATCTAIRGEFGEMLSVGEIHDYYDLSGTKGGILTFERWDGGSAWFMGHWVDPWQLQIIST